MIHPCTQFCYLESTVTENCRCECEVRRRVALAMKPFNKKKYLMCESLSLQLKKTHSQSICMADSSVFLTFLLLRNPAQA